MRAAAEAVQDGLTAAGAPFELVDEEVLGSVMPVFKNRERSLGQLLRDSVAHGDRDYLVTATSRLSFAEHAARVASLAVVTRSVATWSPFLNGGIKGPL